MKFEEVEALMRKNESLSEQYILPENFIIVRLDGKGFTKLTKEKLSLDKPFDEKFSQVMIDTTKHLFNIGFKVLYGYTQSDEISLLIDKDDRTFNRKVRKLNSVSQGKQVLFSVCSFRKSVFSTVVLLLFRIRKCCWIISVGVRKMPTEIHFPRIVTGRYGIMDLMQYKLPERLKNYHRLIRTNSFFIMELIITHFRHGRNVASEFIIKR
jgi:hypothetical protein